MIEIDMWYDTIIVVSLVKFNILDEDYNLLTTELNNNPEQQFYSSKITFRIK